MLVTNRVPSSAQELNAEINRQRDHYLCKSKRSSVLQWRSAPLEPHNNPAYHGGNELGNGCYMRGVGIIN